MKRMGLVLGLVLVGSLAMPSPGRGNIITGPNSTAGYSFSVNIENMGTPTTTNPFPTLGTLGPENYNMVPPGPSPVFQNNNSFYDPYSSFADAWGVSLGTNYGYVALHYPSGVLTNNQTVYNIVQNGTATFTSSTALVSTFLTDTSGNKLLQVDQFFSFAQPNVLDIQTTITNLTQSNNQEVHFLRQVGWTYNNASALGTFLSPFDITTVDKISGSILNASSASYNNPNSANLGNYLTENPPPAQPTDGSYPPTSDGGGGFVVNLGPLSAYGSSGDSTTFNILEAINNATCLCDETDIKNAQTEAQLRQELTNLGATFIVSGHNDDTGTLTFSDGTQVPLAGLASAAIAFKPGATAIPEPGSLLLLSVGGLGLAGYRFRNRRKNGPAAR